MLLFLILLNFLFMVSRTIFIMTVNAFLSQFIFAVDIKLRKTYIYESLDTRMKKNTSILFFPGERSEKCNELKSHETVHL